MILRDSIDPTLIPLDSDAVAGYGDGLFEWTSAGWARFPDSTPRLVIVVSALDAGDVLDVERGNATPAEVPGWCDRFKRPGRRAPTVYCDRLTWPAVRQAVGQRQVDYWIATLDGTVDVAGAVAVQFRDTGAYDESLVLDEDWLGGTMTADQEALLRAVFNLLVYGQTDPGQPDSLPLWGIADGKGGAVTQEALTILQKGVPVAPHEHTVTGSAK